MASAVAFDCTTQGTIATNLAPGQTGMVTSHPVPLS